MVGEASDPIQARALIKVLNPDVLTLDVEMPQMNGLDFLERLMRLRPMPVVMVSTLTSRGAEATLRALELGAVECVAKPQLHDAGSFDRIAAIVRTAAGARPQAMRGASVVAPVVANFKPSERLLAMGASTGGVEALLAILSSFPENCRPTGITKHMPADVLFMAAASVARNRAVGVILTGMGRDGARGLLAMRDAGAQTFGQDEATSVVYGMPKSAFELGAVITQVPLHSAAAAMLAACHAKSGERICRPQLASKY